VPRQSRPFDLAVKWDFTPVPSQAMIVVEEPKLEMRLDGPREVLFGERQTYRLELANTGSGNAENVSISLLPLGTGENVPATHQFGTLIPGEKKIIEVELTARQTGTLTVQVDAKGEGGLEAHLSEKIEVHRAALELSAEGPPMQFVGTQARYTVSLANSGTAAARSVQVTATLPAGVQYLSSSHGGQFAPAQNAVTWTLDNLGVGAQTALELTCSLAEAGSSRLAVAAVAEGDLSASAEVTTRVEAIADVSMQVLDPVGPVPVGGDAIYELNVQNRGTKSAEGIDVMVFFSQGVEPVEAEGQRHRILPGQVVFETIPVLAAGESLKLRVKARAQEPGNHVFRVEMSCKALGTRQVSEETTHFYGTATAARQGSPTATAAPAAGSAAHDDAAPTADRGGTAGNTAPAAAPATPAATGAGSPSSPPRSGQLLPRRQP